MRQKEYSNQRCFILKVGFRQPHHIPFVSKYSNRNQKRKKMVQIFYIKAFKTNNY